MEEPSSPKRGSVFQMAAETADIRSTDALTKYLTDSYTTNPPELADLFVEIPSLAKLGQLIHDVFQSAKVNPMPIEISQLCELGVRHLINDYKTQRENSEQAATSLGKAKRLVDYAALLAQNPSDITLAKLQILELQRENQELATKMEDISNDIKIQQDEYEKLFQEKIDLQNKFILAENMHKNDMSKLRYEYGQLEDSKQSAIDNSKLFEVQITDLKKMLAAASDDSSAHQREIADLKNQIASKNQLINKYRNELKAKDIKFSEFKEAKERETIELSTTLITQNNLLEDKNKDAMRKLARYIKNQGDQIEILTAANRKATMILDKQTDLLDKYEGELEHTNDENEQLNKKVADLRDENVTLKEELEVAAKNSNQDNSELIKLRSIVEQSCTNLAPAFSITPDQLPQMCKELSGTRIDPETAKNLRALNAICDGLSQFIIQLIRTGEANLEFLKEKPIKLSSTVRGDIMHEVEKTRLFLGTLDYSDASEDKVMKYLLNPNENFDLEGNSDVQLSAVLTEALKREREYISKMFGQLERVRDVLPAFDCKTYELADALSTYLLQMQPVFKDLLSIVGSTLHYHGSITDIFACLCRYIEETSSALTVMDEEIRPMINFNGKVVDMPDKLITVLNEYKNQLDNFDSVSKRDLTNAQIDFEKRKAAMERENDGLRDEIRTKEKLVKSLQNQLDKLASDLEETKNSESALEMISSEASKNNKILSTSKQTLEDTISRLSQENNRLESLLSERTQTYEKRVQDLVAKEREMMQMIQEREKKRYEEQQAILERQITDLNNKVQTEQLNHLNAERNLKAQIKKSQSGLRKLEQDKMDMTQTIENMQREPVSNQIIDDLLAKLTDARIKNKELLAEISRLKHISASPSKASPSKSSPSKYSPSKSPSSTMTAAEEVSFVEKVGALCNSFIGKDVTWTKQRVLKTVTAMTEHISNLEQTLDKKGMRTKWSQWAEEVLKLVDPKFKGGITDNEMRTRIGDLCVASGNRTKMIDMITTLRAEKAHLMTNGSESSMMNSSIKTEEPSNTQESVKTRSLNDSQADSKSMNFKSWALASLFVALTRKDNGVSRNEKIPASPPALKGQLSLLK